MGKYPEPHLPAAPTAPPPLPSGSWGTQASWLPPLSREQDSWRGSRTPPQPGLRAAAPSCVLPLLEITLPPSWGGGQILLPVDPTGSQQAPTPPCLALEFSRRVMTLAAPGRARKLIAFSLGRRGSQANEAWGKCRQLLSRREGSPVTRFPLQRCHSSAPPQMQAPTRRVYSLASSSGNRGCKTQSAINVGDGDSDGKARGVCRELGAAGAGQGRGSEASSVPW